MTQLSRTFLALFSVAWALPALAVEGTIFVSSPNDNVINGYSTTFQPPGAPGPVTTLAFATITPINPQDFVMDGIEFIVVGRGSGEGQVWRVNQASTATLISSGGALVNPVAVALLASGTIAVADTKQLGLGNGPESEIILIDPATGVQSPLPSISAADVGWNPTSFFPPIVTGVAEEGGSIFVLLKQGPPCPSGPPCPLNHPSPAGHSSAIVQWTGAAWSLYSGGSFGLPFTPPFGNDTSKLGATSSGLLVNACKEPSPGALCVPLSVGGVWEAVPGTPNMHGNLIYTGNGPRDAALDPIGEVVVLDHVEVLGITRIVQLVEDPAPNLPPVATVLIEIPDDSLNSLEIQLGTANGGGGSCGLVGLESFAILGIVPLYRRIRGRTTRRSRSA